jgi:hypothetical protein
VSPTSRHELKVPPEAAGQRVDLFVGEKLSLSRNRLKALFEADAVRVDGRKVKKGVALSAGQTVAVELPETATGAVADASLELKVLFEDDALVAIDKPAGVPSQPIEPGETGTVANALVARWPALGAVGDDPREAGLCHRLDVETSGVLHAAKDKEAWRAMRAAFSESGAVFGAIHLGGGQDPFIPVLAALGVLLALAYHYSGVLYAAIAIHAVNNAVSTGASQEPAASWVYVVLAVGPLLALGVAVLLGRAIDRWAPASPRRSRSETPSLQTLSEE